MNEPRQIRLPVHLLMLDLVGFALLGFGLFLHFDAGSGLARALPAGIDWVLIGVGVVQVLVAMVLLVRFFAGKGPAKS